MNIPNTLSLLRLFLVTPFLLAVIYRAYAVALVLFVLAGVSDFLDGYLARRLGQKSRLGTFLDPMGDKLLTTVAFISLAIEGVVPAWLAVLVVAKDIYIALGSGIAYLAGRVSEFPPTFWGKSSTVLQISTIGIVLLSILTGIGAAFIPLIFLLTGTVTVIAGIHYVWRGLQDFPDDSGQASG
ncbi:MAG: CDP-diacylglycerol--glycerol-3-phosphate 3-phosphatidyltransferase [Desulfuromonas sp.]|nr:MAG: CDP-diacylglycerol--glycerol-3-phosphate 3-phosphatidyltransferase [Desulfuromonas sp.]